ncbi:MAG TPA: ComEC/Rec2 family competence protein [Candidatus Binatia bacterium]|nr:ComEC/Rec2 family competence protein [Candidatus Binatia bacterium]
MPPDSRAPFLSRYPTAWLIGATLALLGGQALAASPLRPSLFFLVLLAVPLPLCFARTTRQWAIFCLLVGVLFTVGYKRHLELIEPEFPPNHIRSMMESGRQLYLEGWLAAEPERLPQRGRWTVRLLRVWHPTGAEEITGDLFLTIRSVERDWRYGDRVRFRVEPLIPRGGGNPGGFDYAAYLARRGVYATAFLVSDFRVELLARAPPGPWVVLETLRRKIRGFIEQSFSDPDNAALMKALVVGDMGGISRQVRDDFTAAGVNHVLSISGLHVGMLGAVIFLVVRFLGSLSVTALLRWNLLMVATFSSFVTVLFYSGLAGSAVPTVRSAIMIGVYEVAVLLDREEEIFASLAFAALIIAFIWAGVVMDISFQLSFLAVLFIVWGARKLEEWWPGRRRRDQLPQEQRRWKVLLRKAALSLSVPILATIGTGPMIAHHFGHLSWAGFLSNPLVVPLVGFVIVPLGLAIGICALVAPGLAPPLVAVSEPLLMLVQRMVHYLAALPMANLAVPIPDYREVALLYIAILSILIFRRGLHLVLAVGLSLVLIVADGVYWWRERWHRTDLRITHLSVGHGDAAVIEFPGSRVLLVDAGGTPNPDFDTGDFIVAPFLRSRKILRVDYLFLSHPTVDHYGGMQSIAAQFTPEEFWSGAAPGATPRYEGLEDALDRSGIKWLVVDASAPCRAVEGVRLCFLYPPADQRRGVSSVVLRVSYGRFDMLFAGDLNVKDEKILLGAHNGELASAVIKAPRHGSPSANSEEFIRAVAPRLAIFSVGPRSGAAAGEIIERYEASGAQPLRTDVDGAVTIDTDGKTLRYRTYLTGRSGKFDD